jgi:pimeloyl-ACP methyl ester carboxylesterase
MSMYSRRSFLTSSGMALAGGFAMPGSQAQSTITPLERTTQTPVLSIGFEESGSATGFPVILLHGFPDDVRAWDDVASSLARAGHRVLVPYLRGYGPTRFRDAAAPRMAEQAAIGQDVIDFADALGFARFAVAGYDWGGRAACIAAALHPDRVRAAVIIGGYLIQDTITPARPAAPETEQALWYQWYFNTERGRAGLGANRRSLCRLLWRSWSPTWIFNRHRNLNAAGEPRFAALERRLAERPKIEVPSILLHGADDGIGRPPADSPAERASFTSLVARRVIAGAGHFLPREKPAAVSSAMLELIAATR